MKLPHYFYFVSKKHCFIFAQNYKSHAMQKLKTLSLAAILFVCSTSLIYLNACKKDACKNVSCKNGGVCVEGTCNCTTGYETSDCSATIVGDGAGTYSGNAYQSYNGVFSAQSVIVSAGTGINQITLTGLATIFSDGAGGSTVSFNSSAINAYVDLNTKAITIPQQLDATGVCTISGGGALLSNNKITLSYIANGIGLGVGSANVTFTGTK